MYSACKMRRKKPWMASDQLTPSPHIYQSLNCVSPVCWLHQPIYAFIMQTLASIDIQKQLQKPNNNLLGGLAGFFLLYFVILLIEILNLLCKMKLSGVASGCQWMLMFA